MAEPLKPHIEMRHAVRVDVGDGAFMQMPWGDLEWQLRYGNAEAVRLTAAGVISCYAYLIEECTEKEALRRLRLMKRARRELAKQGSK